MRAQTGGRANGMIFALPWFRRQGRQVSSIEPNTPYDMEYL